MGKDFINRFTSKCSKYYNDILNYATRYNLRNTIIALDLACYLHDNTYRDDGAPYVIHPLQITHYLILLNVRNSIYDMNLNRLHNSCLAEEATNHDLDVLFAICLLHDVLEDCINKLPNKNADDLICIYNLDAEVLTFVIILTKDKKKANFSIDVYYDEICNHWQTILAKVVDRTNNCSTINAFNHQRMEKYVRETRKYFYNMCSIGKNMYPEFSRIFTIVKYLIVSICETVASSLNLKDIIIPENPDKSYYFIKGFAIHAQMQNTLKALPLSRIYYKPYTRKSGDPFIIHPLRVASYLISLKIDDDIICAAAILHEIINKCHLAYNGIEIVTKYNLNSTVLDYIRLLANSEGYPLNIYYEALKNYPEVMLLKLSNRANTCTKLIDFTNEEMKEYIDECEKYIYPLCEYGIAHYPMYSYSIEIMMYQISSICNIEKSLRS